MRLGRGTGGTRARPGRRCRGGPLSPSSQQRQAASLQPKGRTKAGGQPQGDSRWCKETKKKTSSWGSFTVWKFSPASAPRWPGPRQAAGGWYSHAEPRQHPLRQGTLLPPRPRTETEAWADWSLHSSQRAVWIRTQVRAALSPECRQAPPHEEAFGVFVLALLGSGPGGGGRLGVEEGASGPGGSGSAAREGVEGGAASGCPALGAPSLPVRRLLLAAKQSQLPWEGAFDGCFF